MRTFGAKIRALRLQHGLEQSDVATIFGISQSHLAHLEAASRPRDAPSTSVVLVAMRYFGVSADFLLLDSWPHDEIPTSTVVPAAASALPPRMLGEKLRFARKRAKKIQQQMATELGMATNGTLSNIEKNRKLPSPGLLIRLAAMLDVSLDWLLNDARPLSELPSSEQA